MKEKLLVTVSGGESSGYMAIKLFNEYQDIYDMHFVYANTGQEHEKTLEFVHNIETIEGLPIVWIEAVVYHDDAKSSGYKVVNYETASRGGEPFEEVIKKYGLPTEGFMHCTRELKINPMNSYMKDNGIKKRTLGIRADEPNRYHPTDDVLYPLYDWGFTTKDKRAFWDNHSFKLEIPEYLGNCTWCYKKSDRKLNLLAVEHKEVFDFPLRMEEKYRDDKRKIFRGYRTTKDVLDGKVYDLFNMDMCAEECGSVIV